VPNIIVSDNGPPFGSEEMRAFCEKLDIVHVTSSPRYPQSNGEAERAVQTVKGFLKKNVNLRMALCAYRDSPLANGHSPAELLFGRSMNSMGICGKVRVDVGRLRKVEGKSRENREKWYNNRHRAKEAQSLRTGERVVVRGPGDPVKATVVTSRDREVVVQSESGALLRRNRSQLRPTANQPNYEMAPEDIANKEQPERSTKEGVLAPQQDKGKSAVKGVLAPSRKPVQLNVRSVCTPESRQVRSEKRGVVAPQISVSEPTKETAAYVTRSGRGSKPPNLLNL
jgi:hypothetical protein